MTPLPFLQRLACHCPLMLQCADRCALNAHYDIPALQACVAKPVLSHCPVSQDNMESYTPRSILNF